MLSPSPVDRRRRVLFVAWFLRPDRPWIAEALDPKKYEWDACALDTRVDITSRRTSFRKWMTYLHLALKARLMIARGDYDLVVTAFPQVGSLLSLIGQLTFMRTPHINWYFNCGHRYTGWRRWLSRLAFQPVNRFVCYTRKEQQEYARTFGLPSNRFVFTYLTGARINRSGYPTVRARYGLAERYVASLGSSSRDWPTLFAAVKDMDVQVVVVTHPYSLEGVTVPANVKPIFSVDQRDYLSILAHAEVCVIPVSNVETASGQMTLIQAMSLEVPVVATQCIGTEDYIEDGETGYLCDRGDVRAIHRYIRRLLDNEDAWQHIKDNAHRFAREHFFENAGSRLLDTLFDEMVATGEIRGTRADTSGKEPVERPSRTFATAPGAKPTGKQPVGPAETSVARETAAETLAAREQQRETIGV